jgi:hypothetical protein
MFLDALGHECDWREGHPDRDGLHVTAARQHVVRERIALFGYRLGDKRWFRALSRTGLFVKGALYVMIGILSGLTAARMQGDFLNLNGAIEKIGSHTLGVILLMIAIVGNFGYSLFKVVAAAADTDRKGSGFVGICKRINMVFRAFIHTCVAIVAIRVLMGYKLADRTGDAMIQSLAINLQEWTRLAFPVYLLGLYMIAAGCMQFYMIYTAYFRRRLRLDHMTTTAFRAITLLGRIGYAARGVVAIGAGAGLFLAGWVNDPSRAHGLGGVLKEIGDQPYVPALLGSVALGLTAYGIFEILLARYRYVVVPRPQKAVSGREL